MYAGPIIDAHHHLWDLQLGRHRWLVDAAVGIGATPVGAQAVPREFDLDGVGLLIAETCHHVPIGQPAFGGQGPAQRSRA